EVDTRNGVQDDALAPVEKRTLVELIPDQLDVRNRPPLHETREVLLHDIGADLASGRHGEPLRTVAGVHLHHQGTEHIDAETAAARAKLGVLAHWSRDMIIDPMI